MAKMKRTRTNYAPEFETMEAMDAAVTLDEAMTAFLLSKKAERCVSHFESAEYRGHCLYTVSCIKIRALYGEVGVIGWAARANPCGVALRPEITPIEAPCKARIFIPQGKYSLAATLCTFQLRNTERASERTLKDYQSHFRYFKAWVDGRNKDLPVSKITTKILHEYVSYMSNEKVQFDDHPTKKRSKKGIRGLSPMTVNVRIRTLRAFLNWAFANGYIRVNIAQNLKLQKVDEDKIMAFTQEQVKKLLLMPDRPTFSGFRDYVLMLMLLDTGLRINELLSIEVSDVDFETLMLTVPWEKAKM